MIFNTNSSQKNFTLLVVGVYLFSITIWYLISSASPFMLLFENGLDVILQTIIKSENNERIESLVTSLDDNFFRIALGFLLFVFMFILLIKSNKIIFSNSFYDFFKVQEFKSTSFKKNLYIAIALASALGLFLELSIIRIHSSYFQLFAYFKNLSLLSCFLGLGIGYSLSKYKLFSLNWVFPIIVLQVAFMFILKDTPITLFFQNPIAEIWNMGQSFALGFLHVSIIYFFIAVIFLFNALAFIPLGHLVAKLMLNADTLKAYSYNLLGSILGILLFTVLSFLWTGPIVWLVISFTVLVFFQYNLKLNIKLSSFFLIFLLLCMTTFKATDKVDLHSPYQNISVKFKADPLVPVSVQSNNIWLQTPIDLSDKLKQQKNSMWHNLYTIPYNVLQKDFRKILIVGSGTGNDVATAVRSTNGTIDAVEIDPLVAELGITFHPEKPYSNERVNLIINDARNFIKKTKNKYDLIVYSLLDSHANLSAKGGVRLDSYVYTKESFFEAKKILTDDGIIFLSFAISTEEMGNKIYKMLKMNFDSSEPIILTEKSRSSKDNFNEGIYAFIVSKNKINLDFNETNFVTTEIFKDKVKYKNVDISTDDWPFFYMSYRIYPISYMVLIIIILSFSVLFLKKHTKLKFKNFSYTSFFLGVGFMLMETKGITELAKIYGSTWMVVSIVITAVLLMAFLANYLVIKKIKISLNMVYFLLILSLIISYLITFIDFYNYSTLLLKFLVPLILTFPVLFSGLAFSKELLNYGSTANALSCNILGAIVGGFLEYNSMYFGFKFLYLLAIAFYFTAYISTRRSI
jgi:spermidine synthase